MAGAGTTTFANIQVSGTGNTEGRGAIRAQSGTLAGIISLMGDTTIGTEGGAISGNISSGVSGTQTLTLGTTAETSGNNITLSGNIGGGTGTIALTKTQSGTTTMTGVNTYTGATTISAGTLQISGAGSLGSGNYAGNISNAGTLQYSSSAAQTLSGNISGAGALTKDTSSTSTLTLSGSNNYTGATTVTLGSLAITNYLTAGAGAININPAAGTKATLTLSGTTTNTGAFTVGSVVGGNAILNVTGEWSPVAAAMGLLSVMLVTEPTTKARAPSLRVSI